MCVTLIIGSQFRLCPRLDGINGHRIVRQASEPSFLIGAHYNSLSSLLDDQRTRAPHTLTPFCSTPYAVLVNALYRTNTLTSQSTHNDGWMIISTQLIVWIR
jgi:hypothetical protein